MKRYKAQIFSALMSICVATTFVGYNFTISNAYVHTSPYKYGSISKASIYLNIENISGETVDGNTDASGELKLIKGKTYTAHVKTSDIQPEIRQAINMKNPFVYIGEKSYKLSSLNIPFIGKKQHAEGDVKFTAGEGELNKENGSETVVFSLRGKINDKYEHINTELEYNLYLETNFVDENGNKIANAQVVKYNEKATKPEGLEKEGYDLSWELNDKVYDFNESVTDNITLKAKYTPKKYEVKFQDNFGNTIAHTVEVNHNETVTEPEAEKKEYYSFKEWQLDGKKYDFSNKIVKPLTLVGEYDKPIGYYVCFIKNEQLHDSRNFTDITKDINAKSKVDKSVLDALYEFDTKNVKGRTKDISEVSDLSNILGDSEEALNERATKIFKSKKERPAWLDKEDYEVKIYRLVIEKDGLHVDMKLIGKDGQEIKPPAKTYTVQFKDDEGNTLSNSQTVKENEKANEPEAPAKEGYKFIGWQLNESKYDFSSPVTQDIVLVAKFEKEQGDNPGNNQGDNPGNNQGDNPGNNQGDNPGNNQGDNPGNNQGDNPGNNQGDNPGNNQGDNPGNNQGDNPGNNQGDNPGNNQGDNPGNNQGDNPGNNQGDNPGNNQGDNPGNNQGDNPGNNQGDNPGNNQGDNPGNNQGDNPGNNQGDNPGNNQGDNPGNNQGDNPGNNQGDNPGNNQGDNPGNNQGDNPGNNQGDNPGNNQGDNPGNNTVGRQPGQSSSGRNRDNNSSSPRTVTPIVTVNDDVVPLSTPNNNNNTSNETVEEETTPLAVPKDDNTNETILEEETTPLAAPDKSIDESKEIAEDAVPLSLPKTGNQDNMLYVLLGMAMSIFGIKKFRK